MRVKTLQIVWHEKLPVLTCEFHKSGCLLTGGADHEIKVWSLGSDNEGLPSVSFIGSLTNHTKPVNCIRFNPQGDCLLSAGDGGEMMLWRAPPSLEGAAADSPVDSWKVSGLLRGHADDVIDACWSFDGSGVASASIENTVVVWDVDKCKRRAVFNKHRHYVQGVAWDPLGEAIVSLSTDRTMKVYATKAARRGKGLALPDVARAKDFATVATVYKHSFAPRDGGAETGTPEPAKGDANVEPLGAGGKSRGTGVCNAVANTEGAAPSGRRPERAEYIFQDESSNTFFRRLAFSPDGAFVAAPAATAGSLAASTKCASASVLFARADLTTPAAVLPSLTASTTCVRFCPVFFESAHPLAPATPTPGSPVRAPGAAAGSAQRGPLEGGALGVQAAAAANATTGEERAEDGPLQGAALRLGAGDAHEECGSGAVEGEGMAAQAATPGMGAAAATADGKSAAAGCGEGSGTEAADCAPALARLGHKLVFAVGSVDSVFIYDTDSDTPLAVLGSLHYKHVTDLAWSPDGRHLAVSSHDGYCTLVSFAPGDLGTPLADCPAADVAATKAKIAAAHTKGRRPRGRPSACDTPGNPTTPSCVPATPATGPSPKTPAPPTAAAPPAVPPSGATPSAAVVSAHVAAAPAGTPAAAGAAAVGLVAAPAGGVAAATEAGGRAELVDLTSDGDGGESDGGALPCRPVPAKRRIAPQACVSHDSASTGTDAGRAVRRRIAPEADVGAEAADAGETADGAGAGAGAGSRAPAADAATACKRPQPADAAVEAASDANAGKRLRLDAGEDAGVSQLPSAQLCASAAQACADADGEGRGAQIRCEGDCGEMDVAADDGPSAGSEAQAATGGVSLAALAAMAGAAAAGKAGGE